MPCRTFVPVHSASQLPLNMWLSICWTALTTIWWLKSVDWTCQIAAAARESLTILNCLLILLMSRWWTQGGVGGSAAQMVRWWEMWYRDWGASGTILECLAIFPCHWSSMHECWHGIIVWELSLVLAMEMPWQQWRLATYSGVSSYNWYDIVGMTTLLTYLFDSMPSSQEIRDIARLFAKWLAW